ncbi:hypothetical protein GCM10010360_62760 [Streptomyces nogalater]
MRGLLSVTSAPSSTRVLRHGPAGTPAQVGRPAPGECRQSRFLTRGLPAPAPTGTRTGQTALGATGIRLPWGLPGAGPAAADDTPGSVWGRNSPGFTMPAVPGLREPAGEVAAD